MLKVSLSTKLNLINNQITSFIFANQQILEFLKEEFKSARNSPFIFCFGQFINSISGLAGVVLQMKCRQAVCQYFMLPTLMINLILLFALITIYGTYEAAVAYIMSMIFWNTGGAVCLRREMEIKSHYYLSIISK